MHGGPAPFDARLAELERAMQALERRLIVKLLAEDLLRSSAATLFVALAVSGGAPIAAPRFMRGRSRERPRA